MSVHCISVLATLLVLFLAAPLHATTYYVSKSGNDLNSCETASTGTTYDSADAKLSIASALTCYKAGDTVFVWRGTYYERLNLPTSGTASSKVTIRGERGPLGEWLTTVDGSEAITGWVLATDNGLSGTGTYRATKPTWMGPITGMTIDPCTLTADGVDIWHVDYTYSDGGEHSYLTGDNWADVLSHSSGSTFWDGVEAFFANYGSYTYVRFRNGDDPNSKRMRVAPWAHECDINRQPDFAPFLIYNKNYITISNFEITGGAAAVVVSGNSTGNIVELNKTHTSHEQMQIHVGPSGTKIRNNLIYSNDYGLTVGPCTHRYQKSYGHKPLSQCREYTENTYNVNKYLTGDNFDVTTSGIGNYQASDTEITNNELYDLGASILNFDGNNVTITGNTVHNTMGSCIYWQAMTGTVTIANNVLYECDTPLRSNRVELYQDDTKIYIYKNRIYNSVENGGIGFWLYLSFQDGVVRNTNIYVYNNTVVGGSQGFLMNAQDSTNPRLPNLLFINNLIQLTTLDGNNHMVYFTESMTNFCSSPDTLDYWAYNWSFGRADGCTWVWPNNVRASDKVIDDAQLPDDWTPSGSALEAGVDCSTTFTVDTRMYLALPGCPSGFNGAAPDVGAVQDDDTPFITTGEISLWRNTVVPSEVSYADGSAVELGVKFKSDVAGYIQSIRFYKGSANTGTHTVSLYTSSGTLLARAVSATETASGWQQVDFTTPVAIDANMVYVASYHTTSGYYSLTRPYLTYQYYNPPLYALADGPSGGNGLYGYTSTPDFPTNTAGAANYWVDVVFVKSGSGIPFVISNLGGNSTTTDSAGTNVQVGYGVIKPSPGNSTPSGFAIFGFRANGVLVSEAGVSASPLITSGRIYAEIDGPVNTGLAIASTHGNAIVSFTLTDTMGQDVQTGSVTIGGESGGQIAAFLNEPPFNGPLVFHGTLSFTSTLPVSVQALRGFTNERSEFLVTTLPVVDTSLPAATGTQVIPHFADGAGWTTQIILVNPTDNPLSGTVQFFSPGSAMAPGTAIMSSTEYSIAGRSSQKLVTSGLGPNLTSGSVRVVPTEAGLVPTPLVIFTYKPGAFTVSESGVLATQGTVFRTYIESSGTPLQPGSVQSGIAIANTIAAPVIVTLELFKLDGASAGPSASLTLPANGQVTKFLSEIFPGLPQPFRGVLRISAHSSIAVVSLRGKYNERSDFLITTTPPVLEAMPSSPNELVFPQLVGGGGYTTQFILFSGRAGEASFGMLNFFSQTGQPINLVLR